VRHVPLLGVAPALGTVDVDAFKALLRTESVRYAAVSLVSNVTGIVNPVDVLTLAARAEGVPIVVDASQAIAHLPVRMAALGDPDALVFSGHKIYAPGSPGVLIVRRDVVAAAEPAELGGGMVSFVTQHDFTVAPDLSEREEAGTPNVVGAVALAAVLEVLGRVGMQTIAEHEHALTDALIDELKTVPRLRLYGSTDRAHSPRIGVASFNVGDFDHGLIASVLNDYYNIAVRNQCFCAQPYARTLLAPDLWSLEVSDDPVEAERVVRRRRGMARASLGMYSTREDIALLGSALREIQGDAGRYRGRYRVDDQGDYHHERFLPSGGFDAAATIDAMLRTALRFEQH
jgi:cysteine desulfurase / selenocysteine lyase